MSVMGRNPSAFQGEDLPVENVSWFDAVKFCNRLSTHAGLERCYNEKTWMCDFSKNGFRLPTEAEWEYACRAGTETIYNIGDSERDLKRAGWYEKNKGGITHMVGQKEPNDWGLYDMHGNVSEWCYDFYKKDFYSNTPPINPSCISYSHYRVRRGGSLNSNASQCRSSNRDFCHPKSCFVAIGFRIVSKTRPSDER